MKKMNATASLVANQPQLELERDLVPGALHVGGQDPGGRRPGYVGCPEVPDSLIAKVG